MQLTAEMTTPTEVEKLLTMSQEARKREELSVALELAEQASHQAVLKEPKNLELLFAILRYIDELKKQLENQLEKAQKVEAQAEEKQDPKAANKLENVAQTAGKVAVAAVVVKTVAPVVVAGAVGVGAAIVTGRVLGAKKTAFRKLMSVKGMRAAKFMALKRSRRLGRSIGTRVVNVAKLAPLALPLVKSKMRLGRAFVAAKMPVKFTNALAAVKPAALKVSFGKAKTAVASLFTFKLRRMAFGIGSAFGMAA